MHALVTGVSGFIGGHLAAGLTARGHRVTGVDLEPACRVEVDRHLTLDLADSGHAAALQDVVSTADVVFHLAGRPGVRGTGSRLAELRHRDNVVATANLLAATPLDTHVVATSSSSVYGAASRNDGFLTPSRETDPVRPTGGYALSKVLMERICNLHRDRGGSITVVRPFTVAGEQQRADMALAIWLDALRRGDPIAIFGSSDRSRDITDVRDVVEGLIRAADGKVAGTVNLGTGVGHRLSDLARTLIDVSGLSGEIVHAPVSTEDISATLADTACCERVLGFRPETDLHAVVERVVSSAVEPAMAAS